MSINEKLVSKLEKVRGLPSPPRVAMKIIDAAQDPDISLGTVAEVITSDPVISAKILRMANSAAYSMPGGVHTLRRALLTLGLDATLIVALSFSIVISLRRDKTQGLDHEYFWRRSLLMATAASALGRALNRTDKEALFLAALVQDIGMLALDKTDPGLYRDAGDLQRSHEALARFEKTQVGCTHADVGQWLLQRWQLPPQLCDAVAVSHDPLAPAADEFSRCVALSGPLADVWLASDWAKSFRELVSIAVDSLGLDDQQLGVVLDDLRDRIPETEALFEKDLLAPAAGFTALEEARELIMERGVEKIIREHDQDRLVQSATPMTLLRMQHRAELQEVLNTHFDEARRSGNHVGLVLAGIDNLDHIRATHGVETADRLIRETARAMLTNCGSRIVGQYTHNEILLWLDDCNQEAAQLAGRRILRDFQDIVRQFSGENNVHTTLALGVAAMDTNHHFACAADLIDAAHAALESAKLGDLATCDDAQAPALTS